MQQVIKQVNQSQEKSEQTLSTFDAMTDGINRNTENSVLIAQLNQQQTEQLQSLHSELNELFNVLAVSADKAGSTSLVASDLHLVSDELDNLLHKFDTDNVAPPLRKTDEQRTFPRINNRIKVMLCQGDIRAEGLTQDISMSGLQIKCKKSFDDRSNLEVKIRLYVPGQEHLTEEEMFVIHGNIVHSDKRPDGFYYGINFESLNSSEQHKLKEIFDYFRKPNQFA